MGHTEPPTLINEAVKAGTTSPKENIPNRQAISVYTKPVETIASHELKTGSCSPYERDIRSFNNVRSEEMLAESTIMSNRLSEQYDHLKRKVHYQKLGLEFKVNMTKARKRS